MHQAKFFQQLGSNKVQCRLCNHYCVVENGKSGKCLVRKNHNGKLYSLSYGHPAAINIDPIEKKPLFHFLPGSLTYSIGTLGCNFRCDNCQNWELSQPAGVEEKTENLNFIPPEKIIEEAIGDGCKSISYTYNEPTVFAEYALDIMRLAHENGLKNVWVSNGFMSRECREAISPFLDAINIDLKSFDDNFYRNICSARLEPVLDNLKYFKNEPAHIEITTLIIPTLSDDLEMLSNIANFIANELDADVPWHISKFSPAISWKLHDLPSTGDDIVYEAYELGKEAGLKYVYVGNMPGDQKENTYCPKCGELAIRRFEYNIERLDNGGRCAVCDKNLDIVE